MQLNTIYNEPNLETMARMPDGYLDCIVTDPPYGYSFMNREWDRAVPSVEIWKECLRVLKPGAFAFIMCAPRQDVLSHMIVNLTQAGFRTDFTSLYHCYASGFPKASNISKKIDKRNGRDFDPALKDYLNLKRKEKGLSFLKINELLNVATNGGGVASALMGDKQFNEIPTKEIYTKLKSILNLDNRFDELIEREEAEREVIGNRKTGFIPDGNNVYGKYSGDTNITADATDQAKALSGAFGGFQPKPALEVIIVVMRPLDCKTFTEQAMKNGKGVTWLDDATIPAYKNDSSVRLNSSKNKSGVNLKCDSGIYGKYNAKPQAGVGSEFIDKGRFPANLLVSDDALNDGNVYESTGGSGEASKYPKYDGHTVGFQTGIRAGMGGYGDVGSFSRYFSLDAWFAERLKNFPKSVLQTFPFLIEPKASKSEKNFGLSGLEEKEIRRLSGGQYAHNSGSENSSKNGATSKNTHNTVKPVRLMSYLITLGSREGEIIYDPFGGSGSTGVAAEMLNRKWILSETDKDSCMIAEKRLYPFKIVQKLF